MNPVAILLVDDDSDMRLYMTSCLRVLGPRVGSVLEAADGLQALLLLRTSPVHLVISDVVLPRLDGYALCAAIRDDPALRHLPVLLVSGEAERPPAGVGADGFLAKPFNARQLVDAVQALLE